jgi:nitrogen-specific signal transduction histidine kinase
MTNPATALLELTALVAALVAVVVFTALRFAAAVRKAKGALREDDARPSFVAAALEDSLRRLREQERQMSARAEQSERLNSEIVSSLASGLLVVGLDGEVRTLNPAARRMLGRPEVESGARLRDVLAEALPLADVVEECLSTTRPILRREIRVDPAGANPTHFGVTVSPLFDASGALHGAISLFSDLTAVVALEDQLRLKDSLARLGELTAGLAHEFRNGLATIHGYARLIDPVQLPAPYAAYVQAIRDETDSLGRIVGNFLNFARPVQPSLAPVNVGELLARTLDDLRADVGDRGGLATMTGEFGMVSGDEVLLRQAMANLVRNAVEACAEAQVVPRIRVEGRVDRAAAALHLTIADNGPGVPSDLREKVFQPFFTTKSTGTGLGLALVQKIVVTHNGRITLSASEDGGAAFHVALPLLRAD